jgi:hypothetical protein
MSITQKYGPLAIFSFVGAEVLQFVEGFLRADHATLTALMTGAASLAHLGAIYCVWVILMAVTQGQSESTES